MIKKLCVLAIIILLTNTNIAMSEENIERSESGDPIYRHNKHTDDTSTVYLEEKEIELLEAHIEKHLGTIDNVWHEIASEIIHVDVYHIKPSKKHNFNILVTSGMSSRAMKTPEGLEGKQYAELVFLLPPDWQLTQEAFKDENNYWPIRWLKILAKLPFEYETWLSYGHTVPNGDPPEPFADNVPFSTIMLLPPISLDEEFSSLKISPKKEVHFYSLIPLYQEETDYKLSKGADSLVGKFDKYGVSDLLDLTRKNTCKKWFGIF